MRRLTVTIFSILVLCGWNVGQSLTSTEIQKVDEIFSQYAKPDSPGCALGIYRNGAVAYSHGYGMASLELGVPIMLHNVFETAEISTLSLHDALPRVLGGMGV